MKKTGFYIIKDKFLKICLTHTLRVIRQVIDRIIIVLRILLWEFIG